MVDIYSIIEILIAFVYSLNSAFLPDEFRQNKKFWIYRTNGQSLIGALADCQL